MCTSAYDIWCDSFNNKEAIEQMTAKSLVIVPDSQMGAENKRLNVRLAKMITGGDCIYTSTGLPAKADMWTITCTNWGVATCGRYADPDFDAALPRRMLGSLWHDATMTTRPPPEPTYRKYTRVCSDALLEKSKTQALWSKCQQMYLDHCLSNDSDEAYRFSDEQAGT